MYKCTVNTHNNDNPKVYEVDLENEVIVNGRVINWDFSPLDANRWHLILDHKTYLAELKSIDHIEKTVALKLNGESYTISVKDKLDQLLDKLGMSNLADSKVTDIKAPMPGLIFEILVNIGDEVKKGEPVLILEAMKMENALKSPGDGVVRTIEIKKGESVEKGQVLMRF